MFQSVHIRDEKLFKANFNIFQKTHIEVAKTRKKKKLSLVMLVRLRSSFTGAEWTDGGRSLTSTKGDANDQHSNNTTQCHSLALRQIIINTISARIGYYLRVGPR